MGCLLRGFVKLHKNTKPHRCRSRQVFTGCFVITKTKRTQYYRATEHALGTLTASFITPTALLMVQTVKATPSPPIWPILLVRTAETVIGAFAALVGIAVGYVRKYPEIVLPRR